MVSLLWDPHIYTNDCVGVYTYLGLAAAGFPNLFFVFGPQGPTAGEYISLCVEVDHSFAGSV